MTDTTSRDVIIEHYREQAVEHGLEPTSTMADLVTRGLEVDAIVACVAKATSERSERLRLLEIGCGNGYLLRTLRDRFPAIELHGLDYSPDMVELADARSIADCSVTQGDIRKLDFGDGSFDVIVSERCVINILDEQGQLDALDELHRVLLPGGMLVLIEAFTDGLENLNRARTELGLAENRIPHHNLWFEKGRFLDHVKAPFDVINGGTGDGLPPRNFLSTHYFMSRVLYPAITRAEIMYNTEFVRFFRFLPPNGDHSPIQLFVLKKIAAGEGSAR